MATMRAVSTIGSSRCAFRPMQPQLLVHAARRRIVAANNEEGAPSPSTSSSDPKVVREYKAWGVKVIESNEPLKGAESEPDFWEGEQFTQFGEAVQKYFLPGLVVLGIVCGIYASNTYNEGATVFVAPANGPDALPRMISADELIAPK